MLNIILLAELGMVIVALYLMSRSRKKHAIVKDVGFMKRSYWKVIRRVSKQKLNSDQDIPNPKSIINDYDYMDWWFDLRGTDHEQKALRK